MSRIVVELLVILLLVALNGLFSMAELAVVSARKGRLRRRAERGDRGARAALELAEDPNRFLATVQVGITFVGILAGAFGGATIAEELADRMAGVPALAPYAEAIALALVVLAVAYLSLIFGELVPKRLALARPEAIAAWASRPLRLLSRLGVPVVRFLGGSTEVVLRSIGVRGSDGPAVTEEDIRSMVKEGVRTGAVTPDQDAMVRRVFALDERPVGTLATRRPEVVWIDASDPPEVIHSKIAASPHSRFPVCEGEIDRILGVVEAKDLLLRGLAGHPLDLHGLLKLPLFVYEGMPASRVLELFRTSPVHVSVVLDEYGSVEGLVTLTDLIGAVMGEFPVPGAASVPSAVCREDGSWLIDGTLPLDEVWDLLSLTDLPGGDYHTLAGFVLWRLRRIPTEGDAFLWGDLRFEVADMDGNRVDKVLVGVPTAGESGGASSGPKAENGDPSHIDPKVQTP
jgi:putative hemolysin